MDVELEHEDNTLGNDTGRKTPEDQSSEKDNTPITVSGTEKGIVPAKMAELDDEESVNTAKEFPLKKNSGNKPHGVNNITTGEHVVYVKKREGNERPASHQKSVVFEIDSSDDHGLHRLRLGTPQRDAADAAERHHMNYEEHTQLLRKLRKEKDKAVQHSSQLQTRLYEYLRMKAMDDIQQHREVQVSELQEYEKHISILTGLKQQLTARSETVQQQAEQLRLQSQEKLDEVDGEWRAFMALKQDTGVTVLSRKLGKQAAQAEMESALAVEQLRQDQLIKLRIRHIKLSAKIERLEEALYDEDNHSKDPLQLQFERLQTERLEQKKHTEKQREESLKLQKKLSGILELLSNVKEKLYWSQTEVQAKQEQLAEVEAVVARKRHHLTRIKQVRNSVQRDNQRLKEHCGLLGNRVLLRDFEDTVDATDHLEEQLENLKCQQADILLPHLLWQREEVRKNLMRKNTKDKGNIPYSEPQEMYSILQYSVPLYYNGSSHNCDQRTSTVILSTPQAGSKASIKIQHCKITMA